MPLLTTPLPLQNSIYSKLKLIFLGCILLLSTNLLGRDYFYPKQEGGKWGIYMHYQVYDKKEGTQDREKWLFKPKWDMVWFDTSRCITTGNGCDGFITFKKGKYGYAWSNGKSLDNEFESINIYNHVAKKNGLWGGFREHIQVLPYEYDSLKYNDFASDYWTRDTSYIGFAGLKQGKWNIMVVKMVKQSPVGNVIILPDLDNYLYFTKGAVVKTKTGWHFVNLKQFDKPVYSAANCDSVKSIGLYYAIRKQNKWFPIIEKDKPVPDEQGWDSIGRNESWTYFKVWENGLVGLIRYENDDFKTIISPRATEIRLTHKIGEDPTIELTENGQSFVYNSRGEVISGNGDITVSSGKTFGPFILSQHQDYKYFSVYDASTKLVLIPKTEMNVEYVNDPVMGEILYIKKPFGYRSGEFYYGLYHYTSKTYLKPDYTNEFIKMGQKYIMNWKMENNSLVFTIWDKKSMKVLNTPFTIRYFKNEYQQALVQDTENKWHQLDDQFTVMDPSKVILDKKIYFNNIEIETTGDFVHTIKRINGKESNIKVEKEDWKQYMKIFEVTIQGRTVFYFRHGSEVKASNYFLPTGSKEISIDMPEKPWPGETEIVPVIFADSANKLVLINVLNNKRIVIPVKPSGNEILHEGNYYSVCNFESSTNINFCRKFKGKCTCNGGYVQTGETRTVTTPGETTYATKKVSSVKTNYEKVWDSKTNTYKGVSTKTPTTTYETTKQTGQGSTREVAITRVCVLCNGVGTREITESYFWDGKSVKKSSFQ